MVICFLGIYLSQFFHGSSITKLRICWGKKSTGKTFLNVAPQSLLYIHYIHDTIQSPLTGLASNDHGLHDESEEFI